MQTISIHRIGLLLRRNVLLYGRKFLAYPGPLLGLMFIVWAMSDKSSSGGVESNFLNTLYIIVMMIIGFYQAAHMLSEHKTADGRQSSLTVPASDGEKFVSSWLYSGPVFLIAYTVVFFLLSWIMTGILGIFGFGGFPAFNPFEEGVLKNIKMFFLVIQPAGLLAAIAFDRAVIPKAFGSLLAVVLGLGALGIFTFRIVYREAFEGFFTQVGKIQADGDMLSVTTDSPFILLFVLGLLLLVATYFKFQEKSV